MVGFPLSIIVNKDFAQDKFLCQNCKQLLKDPLQTYCGHRYCRECFEIICEREKNPRCHACAEEDDYFLKNDETFPDRGILRELNKINVKCPNNMCNWKGTYMEYGKVHEAACPWALIECIKHGCDAMVTRNKLANHLENMCFMRLERCIHCQSEETFSELEKHYGACLKFPITCKYCGMEGIAREKLNGHLESECSRKMVDCPFQDVGCKTLVRKDDISSHNLTTVGEHSVLLLNQTKELSDVIQNMECKRGEVYRIKEQVVEHRTKLSELRTEIQRLCTHMCHTGDQPSVLSQKQNKQVHDTVEQQTKTLSSFQEKLKSLETNIHTYEGVITVLNNQIEQDARTMHTMQTQAIQHVDRIQALERKVSAQDQLLKELALAKQDNTMSEMASHDGELVWKITNFLKKRNDAVSRKTVSIYSPCFYTSRHGYKMCARIYLNGDGMGKGNHVSLFFVIMKGQFDALLRWPFRQKVTLMWLDQNNREHVIDAFRPDPTSSSFKRPEQDMNVASGCPLFMPLTELNSSRHAYVKDDVAFIKIIVDTTDIT